MATINELAEKAVSRIIDDLTDRRGLRQEWEQIDDEIQDEIRETWRDLVVDAWRELKNAPS